MSADRALADHVAVVTGGGTGIGLATARRLGADGARVVLASRDPEHLAAGERALRDDGVPVLTVPTDVRKPEQVDTLVERSVAEFGRVDILINNAAGNFICKAEDGWNAVVDIVLNGSFYCARAIGRHLIDRGAGGAIVSILANYVWTGSPGTIHSAAAKGGVQSMAQTLGVEWARHGIRVNAVAPGAVESPGAARQLWSTPEAVARITGRVPLQRWAQPEEIAETVAFLASSRAGYITGETITIDGGAWLGGGTFGFEV